MFRILWGVLAICFLLSNQAMAEKVIAEVGPYKLYDTELQGLMEKDPQIKQILQAKPELKTQVLKSLIERWVNVSLFALAGKDAKLSEDAEVKKKLQESEKMILAEEYLQRKISQINPTEAELKNYYEKNKANYREPEGVKVRHILIYVPKDADKKTEEKALNRAKQVRAQLLKGAKFEELAKIHSDDTASREKGGDLGVLRAGETVPEFEKSVFKLKPGEISEPIHSPYGYHIVRVDKKIPPKDLTFEEVKARVKEDLMKEKEREAFQRLLQELTQKYEPKIYLEKENRGASKE
jgi:peptidyl-prolyl cis-trans isomerase C